MDPGHNYKSGEYFKFGNIYIYIYWYSEYVLPKKSAVHDHYLQHALLGIDHWPLSSAGGLVRCTDAA